MVYCTDYWITAVQCCVLQRDFVVTAAEIETHNYVLIVRHMITHVS